MDEKIYFSVVMPVYNKAPYVEKSVRSVLSQSCQDFELIVVDDGSTDGSLDVVNKIEVEHHSKMRVISQVNAGVSMARNNGVKEAKGEYICFLDADDWWEVDFLKEMRKLINRYPDAGIYGTGYYIVKNGKNRVAPIGVDSDFRGGYINYCEVYARTLCMPLTSISVALPRGIFDEMGGFKPNLKLGEDFDLWIRIALKYKVAFLNKQLSYYNQDVDLKFRGTRKLHNPQHHMLWNLDYLSEEEQRNKDYKQLIDNIRTYSLLPYYLSKQYREDAKRELAKVDWKCQNELWIKLYKQPIVLLQCRKAILKTGSAIKQLIKKII